MLVNLLRQGQKGYGELVDLAKLEGLSKATSSRYLAQLLSSGVAIRVADGKYELSSDFRGPSWGVLEISEWDMITGLGIDGTYWANMRVRYKVLLGSMTVFPFQEYVSDKLQADSFYCHGSGKPKIGPTRKSNTFSGQMTVHIVFPKPETPELGERTLVVSWTGARTYHMYVGEPMSPYLEAHDMTRPWEACDVTIRAAPMQGVRRVVRTGTFLRHAVILPSGYPVRSVEVRSWHYGGTAEKPDVTRRHDTNAKDDISLKSVGNILTLSVESPQLDRTYSIRWLPPNRKTFSKWFKGLVPSQETAMAR